MHERIGMSATFLFDVDAAKAAAAAAIDAADAALRALSLDIHNHPELGFEEHHAHAALTAFLEERGFQVQRAAYGMPTAFRAVSGSGSPTIAVFCEYDALPEIGHACGHNLIAASGVAVGLALKSALADGQGTIVVLGGPAEEGGGGKIFLLERGALEGVDAAMMLHPSPGDSAWANLIAREEVHVRYRGRNAHAGAAPWEGVNALDALVMAYNGISAMRQQMRPTDRVHGVITEGGVKPNIIPDTAAAEYYIRARNMHELDILRAKITGCFEGAAATAGCTVDIETVGNTYAEVVTNTIMAEAYCENMEQFELVLARGGQGGIAGASTDMGNISYAVPSIHPSFGIPTDAVNHTPGFTASAATPEAHRRMLRAAKALALTAIDLYGRPEMLARARHEFEQK
jgi:amidohydrolase